MTEPVIVARDVAIGWSRSEILLEHASFEVQRGEIFGILGRSACGKSTLLRVLIGLEPPLAGEISIAGLGAPTLAAERPAFGVMFQQGALIGSLTVGENVALALERWTDLPGDAIGVLVRAKLRLVGLEAAEHVLPAALSGGMRKRAALARALALEFRRSRADFADCLIERSAHAAGCQHTGNPGGGHSDARQLRGIYLRCQRRSGQRAGQRRGA